MKNVRGDLIALANAGAFDVIAHGCNCFCTMDAGIAVAVKKTWPAAHQTDLETRRGDRAKLGTCTQAIVNDGRLVVVNAYTQFRYASLFRRVLVDFGAVAACMAWIKEHHPGQRIGLPMIGAGLAGGDWPRIQSLIARELAAEDVTIVQFSA